MDSPKPEDSLKPLDALERLARDGVCHVDVWDSGCSRLDIEDANRQALLKCLRTGSLGKARFEVSEGDQPRFTLAAASMINMGAGYDITDNGSGRLIGIVARQAAKSLLWDSWVIHGPDGAELARVSEDSVWKYFLRKFLLGPLLPMSHVVFSAGGMRIGRVRELIGWFMRRHRLELDSPDFCPLDFRLLIAAMILLAIVQARAEDGSRRFDKPWTWMR